MFMALFLLLIVANYFQIMSFYDSLPTVLATSFDFNGKPSGWMEKDSYFVFQPSFSAFMGFITYLAGSILKYLPTKYINIPYQDYWFTPERRKETIRFIQSVLGWVGVHILAFMVVITQIVIDANLRAPAIMNMKLFWIAVGGISIAVILLIYMLNKKFSNRRR